MPMIKKKVHKTMESGLQKFAQGLRGMITPGDENAIRGARMAKAGPDESILRAALRLKRTKR